MVTLDSFAGTSDGAKLRAAMGYAAAQTIRPEIVFPERDVYLSGSFTPYTGMRLVSCRGSRGAMNPEVSTSLMSRIRWNGGTGTASLFVAAGTCYDVNMSGLMFENGMGAGQFWHQPYTSAGTLYASQFDALTFYGFRSVFGDPTTPLPLTQCIFSGHWTVLGGRDVQLHLTGSDNSLWMGGLLNIGGGAVAAPAPLLRFSTLAKTDVGKVFITAAAGWRGIEVNGRSHKLNFYGGEYEGTDRQPGDGNLIRVNDGSVAMFGPWIHAGMGAPAATENACVEVTGGNLALLRPTYGRTPTQTATSPKFLHQSGGFVSVSDAVCSTSATELPGFSSTTGRYRVDDSVALI